MEENDKKNENEGPNSSAFFGILLVAFGGILLMNSLFGWNFFRTGNLWPIFILLPGLLFEYAFFAHRGSPGLLVPGGILIVLGCLFFFQTITGWHFAEYTWPIYIIAPAAGLFQLYLFGGRQKGLLIPVGVLTTIAVISQSILFLGKTMAILNKSIVLPAVIIVLGLIFIFARNTGRK